MAKSQNIRILNSSKQMILLHARPPKGDFYLSEQQISLIPGKDVTLPKSHIMMDQIENLQRRGMIKITYNDKED